MNIQEMLNRAHRRISDQARSEYRRDVVVQCTLSEIPGMSGYYHGEVWITVKPLTTREEQE